LIADRQLPQRDVRHVDGVVQDLEVEQVALFPAVEQCRASFHGPMLCTAVMRDACLMYCPAQMHTNTHKYE
jgi:hypothetical protein